MTIGLYAWGFMSGAFDVRELDWGGGLCQEDHNRVAYVQGGFGPGCMCQGACPGAFAQEAFALISTGL